MENKNIYLVSERSYHTVLFKTKKKNLYSQAYTHVWITGDKAECEIIMMRDFNKRNKFILYDVNETLQNKEYYGYNHIYDMLFPLANKIKYRSPNLRKIKIIDKHRRIDIKYIF